MSLNPLPLDLDAVVLQAALFLRSEIDRAVREAVEETLPGAIRAAGRPDYMTRGQAAEYIGRSIRSLDYLRKAKRIAWSKRGGRVMIRTDDLDAYLEEGRVPAKRSRSGEGA